MFGLLGACLAMYQTAKPENRVKVKAILIPAVVTSFIAGVTEPIGIFVYVRCTSFVRDPFRIKWTEYGCIEYFWLKSDWSEWLY